MRSLTSAFSHRSTFKGPSDISEHTDGEGEAVERSTVGTVTAKYKDESFLSTHEHERKFPVKFDFSSDVKRWTFHLPFTYAAQL